MSNIGGCKAIQYIKNKDHRGFFSRIISIDDAPGFYCKQSSIAHNISKGTARGLHVQDYPVGENKIVTCISGSAVIFVFDARIGSPTYKNVFSMTMSSSGDEFLSIYVPKYCAFGYITLTDNCDMLYHMDECFHPDKQIGYRLTDKIINIDYDFSGAIISDKDKSHPDFTGGI